MLIKSLGAAALVLTASVATAAGVSTTNFSGTGYSNSVTVGGYNNVTSFAGATIAQESAEGVASFSSDIYIGQSADFGTFRQVSSSVTEFEGVATSNGLVGRTIQESYTESSTIGRSIDESTESRIGLTLDISVVGDFEIADFSDDDSDHGDHGDHPGHGNGNGNGGNDDATYSNGISGFEIGTYENDAYSRTVSNYGSDSYAETYSVNSYGI